MIFIHKSWQLLGRVGRAGVTTCARSWPASALPSSVDLRFSALT